MSGDAYLFSGAILRSDFPFRRTRLGVLLKQPVPDERRERRRAASRRHYQKNKEKVKGWHKDWVSENRDHLRSYSEQRYKENPEPKKQSARRWRRANPGYNSEACKSWRTNNPDKVKDHARRSAQMRREAPGSFSVADIRDIRRMQKRRCAYCKTRLKIDEERIDHIIALARGGTHDRSNLQILCHPCNSSKYARDPIEFARSEHGLLL